MAVWRLRVYLDRRETWWFTIYPINDDGLTSGISYEICELDSRDDIIGKGSGKDSSCPPLSSWDWERRFVGRQSYYDISTGRSRIWIIADDSCYWSFIDSGYYRRFASGVTVGIYKFEGKFSVFGESHRMVSRISYHST